MPGPSPRVVRALADTFFPAAPDAPAGSEVVPDRLDDLLASMDPADVKQLAIGVSLIEHGAIARHGRRFSSLGPEARERYLLGWKRSRLAFRRLLYRALRNLVTNLYYADERTWDTIGYAGPR